MKIENNKPCFVQLWRDLEQLRQLFDARRIRYCVRNILKYWLGAAATCDLIWEVCINASTDENPVYGYDELPSPAEQPSVHREILRALTEVCALQGRQKVHEKSIDSAYSVVFPTRPSILTLHS